MIAESGVGIVGGRYSPPFVSCHIERAMLYILMVLLPFYRLMEVDFGVALIGFVDFLIVCAGLMVCLKAQARIAALFSLPLIRRGSALLFLGVVLSVLNSTSLRISFVYTISLALKYLLLILVYSCCDTKRILRNLLVLYVLSNTVSAVIAIGQQYGLISSSLEMQSVSGAFDARSEMIYYIVPAFIICLMLVFSYTGVKKVALSIILVILFISTLLSRGRSGVYIEVLISFLYVFFVGLRSRKKLTYACLLSAIIALVMGRLILAIPDYMEDLRSRYLYSALREHSEARGSLYVREEVLLALLDAWRSSPYIGIGAGTFRMESSSFVQIPGVSDIQPHNSYLGLLAESGVIAFIGLVMICWSGLKQFWIARIHDKQRVVLYGLVCAYLSILMVMAVFDGFVRYNFWLFLGLLVAAAQMYGAEDKMVNATG